MRRLSYEYVKNYFEEHNCLLLDKEYVNNRRKLNYRCLCGNVDSITFGNFKNGGRCRKCGDKKGATNRRQSRLTVKGYFEKHGCILLGVYENYHKPVSYQCVCGNISKIAFSSFKNGRRCKLCGRRKQFGKGDPNWTDDKNVFLLNKKIRRKYKGLLNSCLSYIGIKKNSKTEEMLGYSPIELKNSIFAHPNWNNVKNDKWHIDHIFPIKAFLDNGITDVKLINCLENLQPLEWRDNLAKGSVYDEEKFKNWLKSKGVQYASV